MKPISSSACQKIQKHLEKQYKNIFSPDKIQRHIDEYVAESQPKYLVEKIKPLISNNSKILDVGAGYGSFTIIANENGYKCFGIEIEDFEYAISQERAKEEKLNPVVFSHGSALDLPFEDESFDVVTFWNVLEHIANYRIAIKEAVRVLKPKGKIFIVAPNYFAFRKEAHYHVPWFPLLPKFLGRIYLRLMKRDPSFLNNCIFYITMWGLRKCLKKNGLSITVDIAEKIQCNYSFRSSTINKVVSIFERMKMKKLLIICVAILKQHPFVTSIDVIAQK